MIQRIRLGNRGGFLRVALAGGALCVVLGCDGLRQVSDIGRVQDTIGRMEATSDVSVALETGHVLHVSIPNQSKADAARADVETRFRRVANAAFLAYPSRSGLEAVRVTAAAESRRFRPIDLIRQNDLSEHWVRQGVSATRLYLVAIGHEPAGVVDRLPRHFRDTLGIAIEQLPAMTVPERASDPARSQLIAEELAAAIPRSYPAIANDPQARVIGITGDDMYLRRMRWAFGFSLRSDDERIAIVSYARMDPEALGLSRDDELLRNRVAKMVAKDIGILCFGLPVSNNPRSALYGNIGGTDELDVMTEYFDPR